METDLKKLREQGDHIRTDTPEGTPVLWIKDDGSVTQTKTRSLPWKLGSGQWVVKIIGIAGGYAIERIRYLPRPQPFDVMRKALDLQERKKT